MQQLTNWSHQYQWFWSRAFVDITILAIFFISILSMRSLYQNNRNAELRGFVLRVIVVMFFLLIVFIFNILTLEHHFDLAIVFINIFIGISVLMLSISARHYLRYGKQLGRELRLQNAHQGVEQEMALRTIQRQEEVLRVIVNSVEDYAIYLMNSAGFITTWNKGAEKMTGYSATEIIGKHFSILFPDREKAREVAEGELRSAAEKGSYYSEAWRVGKEGKKFFVYNSITPIKTADGNIFGFIKILRDLTEQRKNSEILLESEERFRGTFEQAAVGIAHVTLDGHFLRINQKFCDITGYSKQELVTLNFQSITHPQDLSADVSLLEQLIANKIPTYTLDKRYICKNGEVIWVALTVSLNRDSSGEPTYAIAVVQDIQERKVAEKKLEVASQDRDVLLKERTKLWGDETARRLATQDSLERREAELQLVMGVLPAAIIYIDVELNFCFCNSVCEKWVQRSRDEIIGHNMKAVLGDFFNAVYPYVAQSLTGKSQSVDLIMPSQGKVRPVHLDFVPDIDSSGKIRGFIVHIVDNTASVLAQEELRNAKLAAESANLAKSAFLANMSHEIRTPLGAILGFSEIICSHDITVEKQKRFLEIIKRNGELLCCLINDILDLSKVEAGKIELEVSKVPLEELIKDVLTTLDFQAKEKAISLNLHMKSHIPSSIMTDSTRLRQILINIIGNAVKFTEKGSVDISVMQISKDDQPMLKFEVQDSGCGLTQEQVQRLFQPFSQADASTKRKYGGSGLGLILSRKLANLLGGDVVLLQTKRGYGSTFVITIALQTCEDSVQHPFDSLPLVPLADKAQSLEAKSILVVEDATDIQMLIQCYLQKAGAAVDIAGNGLEAIEKASMTSYDIILMDIQMPIMDGFEAISYLRSHGYTKPVIALTANAMKSDLEKCLAAGFDAHISKPVDQLKLLAELLKFLQSRKLNLQLPHLMPHSSESVQTAQ